MKNRNTAGLFFIAIGVIFLLFKSNFFGFPFSFINIIRTIIDWWPVTLIVIGLSTIFYKKTVFKMILWICFLVALVFFSSFRGGGIDQFHFFIENGHIQSDWNKETVSKKYDIDLNEALEDGLLEVNLGACQLNISQNNKNGIKMKSNMNIFNKSEVQEQKLLKVRVWEEDLTKNFSKSRFTNIRLDDQVTWRVHADLGAVNANIDLSDLIVQSLILDVGAGNVDVFLGTHNNGKIHVNGGASNTTFHVPEALGIKIIKNGKLITVNDQIGLKKIDEGYLSDNYEEADNKYTIYLNTNAANITLVEH